MLRGADEEKRVGRRDGAKIACRFDRRRERNALKESRVLAPRSWERGDLSPESDMGNLFNCPKTGKPEYDTKAFAKTVASKLKKTGVDCRVEKCEYCKRFHVIAKGRQ